MWFSHTYLDVLSLKILAKVGYRVMLCPMQTYSNYFFVNYIRSVHENNLMCLNFS